jgi:mannosyltransferase OCH1-like enzyme
MVPKVLHIIWIGDESKRPDELIKTWRDMNPTYTVKVWGNKEYEETTWRLKRHMDYLYPWAKAGVADLMRYEILYNEGGVTLDADSYCIAPLEDWLLKPSAFTNWEQEHERPGLLGVNMMGGVKGNEFWKMVIDCLDAADYLPPLQPWIATGPRLLTKIYKESKYPLTVYPSHYVIRDHFSGISYGGDGHCFATQTWYSTTKHFDSDEQADEKLKLGSK